MDRSNLIVAAVIATLLYGMLMGVVGMTLQQFVGPIGGVIVILIWVSVFVLGKNSKTPEFFVDDDLNDE